MARHIPRLFDAIVALLVRSAPADEEVDAPLDDPAIVAAATAHAQVRFEQGLGPAAVVTRVPAVAPGDRTGPDPALGLYACRGIVLAHGGTITPHSNGPGYGTTVTVELPPLAEDAADAELG